MANQTMFSPNFPVQAAPVERRSTWGAMGGGPGVEASDIWDDVLQGTIKYGPSVAKALSSWI